MARKYLRTNRPIKGAFFSLGDVAVGATKGFQMLSEAYEADRRLLSYLSQEDGGGYFSNALRVAFIHKTREWVKEGTLPGASWEPYNDRYEKWKNEKYPGGNFWYRSGQLMSALKSLRKTKFGQTVGFDPNEKVHRHGFGGGMEAYGSSYTADKLAKALHFGSHSIPGMPARPMLNYAFQAFVTRYFPKMKKAVWRATIDSMSKHQRFAIDKSQAEEQAKALAIGEYTLTSGMGSGMMQEFENQKIRIQRKTENVVGSITSHEETMADMKKMTAELASKGSK
jgi:hypothetical protein